MRDKTKQSAYVTWCGMKQRCNDEGHVRYSYYGGRGIKVCERWQNSFSAFFEDMGPRPFKMSIERIDTNGNYEPSNCRWATRKEQARNTRRKRVLTIDGVEYHLSELAEKYGIDVRTLDKRLQAGWPHDKAFSKELQYDTSSLPAAVAANAAKKRAQTHCKRGHELSGDNLYLYQGRRHCRACRRGWERGHYE